MESQISTKKKSSANITSLPIEIIVKEIGKFLSSYDKKNLAIATKLFYQIFLPTLKTEKERQYALLVLDGLTNFNQDNKELSEKETKYVAFLEAIKIGNLGFVKEFLSDPEILEKALKDPNPTTIALFHGRVKVLEYLLKEKFPFPLITEGTRRIIEMDDENMARYILKKLINYDLINLYKIDRPLFENIIQKFPADKRNDLLEYMVVEPDLFIDFVNKNKNISEKEKKDFIKQIETRTNRRMTDSKKTEIINRLYRHTDKIIKELKDEYKKQPSILLGRLIETIEPKKSLFQKASSFFF